MKSSTPGRSTNFKDVRLSSAIHRPWLCGCELNQIDIAEGRSIRRRFDVVRRAAPANVHRPRHKDRAGGRKAGRERNIEVFLVEATLVDADPAIRPGMTADVRFQIDVRPDVMSVPIEAAVKKSDGKVACHQRSSPRKRHGVSAFRCRWLRNDFGSLEPSGVIEGEKLLIDPAPLVGSHRSNLIFDPSTFGRIQSASAS